MFKQHWGQWAQWLGAAVLMGLSLRFLVSESGNLSPHEIGKLLAGSNVRYLFGALLLTAFNYLVATGYDFITATQLRLKVPRRHLGLISFIAFTYNNNLGMGALTGALVRFRFLSRFRFSARVIGKYMLLFSWLYWLGLLVLGAVNFLFVDQNKVILLPFTTFSMHSEWLGLIPAIILTLFLFLVWYKKSSVNPSPLLFPIATPPIAACQVVVSTLDWLILSGVFYLLLPHHSVGYERYFSAFILAQLVSVLSHAPAGLGSFDAVIIYYLKPYFGINSLVSSLILFRLIYFFIPFVLGSAAFIGYEYAWKRRKSLDFDECRIEQCRDWI
jgi:uncharacterized membrane protein YbhN (UPF0104 family)